MSLVTSQLTEAWFRDQVPEDWFSDLEVLLDRDELMVLGTLLSDAANDAPTASSSSEDGHVEQAELERIEWFREETRTERVDIASRAEAKFQRKVSWAARHGSTHAMFTHQSVPVMTRLRIEERQVLDTLISAGVARSRSDALAWCVRRLGKHESEWLTELRDAISSVEEVRAKGPS